MVSTISHLLLPLFRLGRWRRLNLRGSDIHIVNCCIPKGWRGFVLLNSYTHSLKQKHPNCATAWDQVLSLLGCFIWRRMLELCGLQGPWPCDDHRLLPASFRKFLRYVLQAPGFEKRCLPGCHLTHVSYNETWCVAWLAVSMLHAAVSEVHMWAPNPWRIPMGPTYP